MRNGDGPLLLADLQPTTQHRRVPDRLVQGTPPHLLSLREDGEELRRHDQDHLHTSIDTSSLQRVSVFRQSLDQLSAEIVDGASRLLSSAGEK